MATGGQTQDHLCSRGSRPDSDPGASTSTWALAKHRPGAWGSQEEVLSRRADSPQHTLVQQQSCPSEAQGLCSEPQRSEPWPRVRTGPMTFHGRSTSSQVHRVLSRRPCKVLSSILSFTLPTTPPSFQGQEPMEGGGQQGWRKGRRGEVVPSGLGPGLFP